MNAWQQLSVNALLGTQKNTTPIEWPSAELNQINQQLSTHHAPLLAQLALMSVYQRAGQQATKLTPQEPAQSDTKQAATLHNNTFNLFIKSRRPRLFKYMA
jgi:hypothetical protein